MPAHHGCGSLRAVFAGTCGLVILLDVGSVCAQDRAAPVETVTVIGVSPLPGTTIDANKLPGEVENISVTRLSSDRPQPLIPDLARSELADVSLNDEQGSPFQPDFVYRGFEASPIAGVAEGVAVYQNGVRLNESFGDSVNWDLVPQFAVERFTLQSNNPVFGLNAIGGALTLAMKDGFGFDGTNAELSGGSFGNFGGNAQYGAQFGRAAVYLGLGGLHDDGFRSDSPSALRQAYADLGYQAGDMAMHLSLSGAMNDIGALGPTPVQLLDRDARAVFTKPQSTQDAMGLAALRGSWQPSTNLLLSANAYIRRFRQDIVDGNTTDVTLCTNDPAQLCLEGDDVFPRDALYDAQGLAVPASVLPIGATPGETDFTRTETTSFGSALQASSPRPLFGHGNTLELGASIDSGVTEYAAHGELGALLPNLQVAGIGITIDQALNPTAAPPIESPVGVQAKNTYTGIYALDVFDITPRLAWTLSGRFNIARVDLTDRLGSALDGSHTFARFDPGTGLAYQISGDMSAYAGYSQSNRAPTPAEISCSNPGAPCLMDAFLVSDPGLKQVVASTIEAGLRGGFVMSLLPGRFVWNVGAFRTDAADDIQLLATAINGFGYFANAGTTRRQGMDLHLGFRSERVRLDAGYAFLQATFRDALTLSSNSPAANAQGLIYVRPGDELPLNPGNRITLDADISLTPDWSAGFDARFVGSQYLAGDQSNQARPIPAYAALDVRTSFRIDDHLQVLGEIENLTSTNYYTYGAFADLAHLPPALGLTDARSLSPAPGRLFYAGIRLETG